MPTRIEKYLDAIIGSKKALKSRNPQKEEGQLGTLKTSNLAIKQLQRTAKNQSLIGGVITKPQPVFKGVKPYFAYKVISNLKPYQINNQIVYSAVFQNIRTIEPVKVSDDPFNIGDFLIWPDTDKQQLFYLANTPQLLEFSLTIIKEQVQNTIKVTGGSAVLTVSTHIPNAVEKLEALRTEMNSTTFESFQNWRFRPVSLKKIEGSILSAGNTEISEVKMNAGVESGTAIFLIELTELGALNWKDLFETGEGNLLQGICNLEVYFFAKLGDNLRSEAINLQSSLGALASMVGPPNVQILNPEVTLTTRIIVQGNPQIDAVTVDINPSKGLPPEPLVFDAKGGQGIARFSGSDISDLTIDLSYRVNFKEPNWPIINKHKRLQVSDTEWTDLIDPATWVQRYNLMVFLVSDEDNIVNESSQLENNRVICELTYTADFLESGSSISTIIETSSEVIEEIQFPRPEGTTPGNLKLTVIPIIESKPPVPVVKIISSDTSTIIITVNLNGGVDILTNIDPTPESSFQGNLMNIIGSLTPKENEKIEAPKKTIALSPFQKLLRYLNVDEETFWGYEDQYFGELDYLIYENGIPLGEKILDRTDFYEAVKAFQGREGLITDGIPGEATLWHLQKDIALKQNLNIVTVDADQVLGYESGFNRFRLRQDLVPYYEDFRAEILGLGGVITSSGSLRGLSASITPGRSSKSMHYTGIAFDLYINSGMRNPERDPYIIVENGRKWIVYCKVEEGGEVEDLEAVYWRGKEIKTKKVRAQVINFTEIAIKHGFRNISRRRCFPNNYLCAEWWHFQNEWILVPYISQFGIELLRLGSISEQDLKQSPLWFNRKKIFKKSWF